jgi:hypothetical protein
MYEIGEMHTRADSPANWILWLAQSLSLSLSRDDIHPTCDKVGTIEEETFRRLWIVILLIHNMDVSIAAVAHTHYLSTNRILADKKVVTVVT